MTLKIDYLSDIHVDSWCKDTAEIESFVHNLIPIYNQSQYLIIAGDLANSNDYSYELLSVLSKIYDKVYIVFGNHDYYLIGRENQMKYAFDSNNRVNELVESLPANVIRLNGESVQINGFKIGGSDGWYDLSYSHLLKPDITGDEEDWVWENISDSRFIFENGRIINWRMKSEIELEKLNKLTDSDILITHVPLCQEMIEPRFKNDLVTGCFYTSGQSILRNMNGKVVISGHIHSPRDYINSYGVRILCNPLGYRGERVIGGIKTLEI